MTGLVLVKLIPKLDAIQYISGSQTGLPPKNVICDSSGGEGRVMQNQIIHNVVL